MGDDLENKDPEKQETTSGKEQETTATEGEESSPKDPLAGKTAEELRNFIALQNQAMAELGNQQMAMRAQLNDLNKKPAVEKTSEEKAKDFFADPDGVIEKKLEAVVGRMIAPLIEFTGNLKKETKIDKVKNKFKNDERLGYLIDNPVSSAAIDQALKGIDEPNEQQVRAVLFSLHGAASLGELGGVTPPSGKKNETTTEETTNGEKKVTRPAHLQSSRSPGPKGEDKKPKLRDLTELEKRLARENGMSEEEYIQFQESDAVSVATSKIGIKETK